MAVYTIPLFRELEVGKIMLTLLTSIHLEVCHRAIKDNLYLVDSKS